MKSSLVALSCLVVLLQLHLHSVTANRCGTDWVPYKDELCYKVVDTLVTKANADIVCANEGSGFGDSLPTLLVVKSPDEQTFLNKFIFQDSFIVDNVWLGATRDDDKFKWNANATDNIHLSFTNWATGFPTVNLDNNCTQLTSANARQQSAADRVDEGLSGLWKDVPCTKRNVVVCQKIQLWTSSELQKQVMSLRSNPVPIGYIYIEIASQAHPNTMWTNMVWEDVTSEYAGLFFRAEGGGSGKFGEVQGDNSPRLTNVGRHWQEPPLPEWSIECPAGSRSNVIHTGYGYNAGLTGTLGLRFHISGGEVRPKNSAIRIWKRIQ